MAIWRRKFSLYSCSNWKGLWGEGGNFPRFRPPCWGIRKSSAKGGKEKERSKADGFYRSINWDASLLAYSRWQLFFVTKNWLNCIFMSHKNWSNHISWNCSSGFYCWLFAKICRLKMACEKNILKVNTFWTNDMSNHGETANALWCVMPPIKN